jgi:phosphoglucomutase
MNDYRKEYRRWMDSPALNESEWRELNAIAENDEEIKSRFYAALEFGPAGLRGVMGAGTNRMNKHVVKHATQAFAELIVNEGPQAMKKGVIIAYDCRVNSDKFAREAARVMAANGVSVKLFESLRPTPELSFAIRHYGAQAGINITASHNTKEYNGYKVYWSDGAQLPPDHAKAVANKMSVIDIFSGVRSVGFDEAVNDGHIEIIGDETDELFLNKVLSQAVDPGLVKRVAKDFRVVYTPFHGAGYRLVPEALRRLGIEHIFPVPEQMVTDGLFPTVKSPNPENPEGFKLAVELAKEKNSDLIIGTDPDSDRVGTMVRSKDGEFRTITGNQMGVLLLDYIINAKKESGAMPERPAALKTIVTTEMARTVAKANGIHIEDTFTGFKFMAEKLAEYEADNGRYNYIFAFEESYGYMMGDFVRDKDAVTASMMIAEMAAFYHEKGLTLLDAMEGLYEKYGWYAEKTLELVMPGIDGLERMRSLMRGLREKMPSKLAETSILRQRDYESGKISVPGIGVVGKTEISGSNVLYYELEDDSSFIIRPSGTEPKIKIYVMVRGSNSDECAEKIERLRNWAETLKG